MHLPLAETETLPPGFTVLNIEDIYWVQEGTIGRPVFSMELTRPDLLMLGVFLSDVVARRYLIEKHPGIVTDESKTWLNLRRIVVSGSTLPYYNFVGSGVVSELIGNCKDNGAGEIHIKSGMNWFLVTDNVQHYPEELSSSLADINSRALHYLHQFKSGGRVKYVPSHRQNLARGNGLSLGAQFAHNNGGIFGYFPWCQSDNFTLQDSEISFWMERLRTLGEMDLTFKYPDRLSVRVEELENMPGLNPDFLDE